VDIAPRRGGRDASSGGVRTAHHFGEGLTKVVRTAFFSGKMRFRCDADELASAVLTNVVNPNRGGPDTAETIVGD